MSDLSWLNPTPHAIAVYASSPLSPAATQHSLPSRRYPLLGPDLHRLIAPALPGAFLHSISSSAATSSVCGTVRPRALSPRLQRKRTPLESAQEAPRTRRGRN